MEYLTILCFTDKGKSVSLKWSVLFCQSTIPLTPGVPRFCLWALMVMPSVVTEVCDTSV